MKRLNWNLPPVGMRIVKSAIAVYLCFAIYTFFGLKGSIYYASIAALWAMQPYYGTTKSIILKRVFGTMVGALFGFVVLMFQSYLVPMRGSYLGYIVDTLILVLVIYTLACSKHRSDTYFACVIFLGITVTTISMDSPIEFVIYRITDTYFGMLLGFFVNCAELPRKKNRGTLYVAGLDGTLLNKNMDLNAYSAVRLNRMVEQGMKFTVSTLRTPASIIDTLRDVDLHLPIIAMDGAVLFDIKKKEYLKAYVISPERVANIQNFFEERGIHYFLNTIVDQVLIIYYGEFKNEVEQDLFARMRCSPYRNYIHKRYYKCGEAIYFMTIGITEEIEALTEEFRATEDGRALRVETYVAVDYPGYSDRKSVV